MTTPSESPWRDDAITSPDRDTLDRAHIPNRVAQLINGTHTWESSMVFAITGPWGSGKTSLLELTCNQLSTWHIARFTPWAASNPDSLLAEFYSALTTALPKTCTTKKIRAGFAQCLTAASPLANYISMPFVGQAVAKAVTMAADALAQRPSWNTAFTATSKALAEKQIKLLVVIDDMDRLQPDELLAVLRVIRLLGRFPGVSYLLAYDEDTLFATLTTTNDRDRARRFMEKIVQYPIAMPPMLPHQITQRLYDGLEQACRLSGHTYDRDRLDILDSVSQTHLATPRAIDRLLAQCRLALSLHQPKEVDATDLILLTFTRTQFPDLYANLPRWRNTLTQIPIGHFPPYTNNSPDLTELYEKAHPNQEDAKKILGAVFPVIKGSNGPNPTPLRATHRYYFSRYLVHTIPTGDLPDGEVLDAITAANQNNPKPLSELLHKHRHTAVPKLKDYTTYETDFGLIQKPLLAAAMACLSELPADDPVGRSVRDWAAAMLAHLTSGTPAQDLEIAVDHCTSIDKRVDVLQRAWYIADQPMQDQNQVTLLLQRETGQLEQLIINHLRLKDDATDDDPIGLYLQILINLNQTESLAATISEEIRNNRFTTEDLAARFVDGTEFQLRDFRTFAPPAPTRFAPHLSIELPPTEPRGPNQWRHRREIAADILSTPGLTQA